jgi:hypothetical protein
MLSRRPPVDGCMHNCPIALFAEGPRLAAPSNSMRTLGPPGSRETRHDEVPYPGELQRGHQMNTEMSKWQRTISHEHTRGAPLREHLTIVDSGGVVQEVFMGCLRRGIMIA